MPPDQNEEPEEMAGFFDLRAEGYEEHITQFVFTGETFAQFYQAAASAVAETDQPVEILDLGCGTGLEFEFIFQRAPNARITGVDLSGNMLGLLRERYRHRMSQITLVEGSYLTMPLGRQAYDAIVSILSMHHLLHPAKLRLYRRVRSALKPGGRYIEGDSVTLPEMEAQFIAEYNQQVSALRQAEDGQYHIDVPFSIETQRALLLEAGFVRFDLLWQLDPAEVWNAAVYAVEA